MSESLQVGDRDKNYCHFDYCTGHEGVESMSEPVSEERIAEIRDREAQATPGPWRSYLSGSEGARIYPDTGARRNDCRSLGIMNGRGLDQDKINAAFVANARTDMSALLAAYDAMKDERDRALAHAAGLQQDVTAARNQSARLAMQLSAMDLDGES